MIGVGVGGRECPEHKASVTTKENVAIGRRVEDVANELAILEPVRITTLLEVYGRGYEPRCTTLEHIHELAGRPAKPTLLRTSDDLDVLIDAESGVHACRHQVDADAFEREAAGVRQITHIIRCHERQEPLIVSCWPLTKGSGGARAGKTRAMLHWLFRQWLMRGRGSDDPAVLWWIREDTEKLHEHAITPMLRVWPEVFVGRAPSEKDRAPQLRLLDGSKIAFRHAHHSGRRAGSNLRSANPEAIAVDELTAILNRENWLEIQARVRQTGGPIMTQTTPLAGHWDTEETDDDDRGGTTYHAHVDVFQNPWITLAQLLRDMLKERLVTADQMRTQILPASDQVEAAKRLIVRPDARRSWLGAKVAAGRILWAGWREDMIVRDDAGLRETLTVDRHGELPNITSKVLGQFFKREDRPRPGAYWIGQDFNVNPCVGVVLELFGHLHRRDTWHVLVVDEIVKSGPTAAYAAELTKRYPRSTGFCDPNGAMPGRHASHGASSSTDAAEINRAGHYLLPAHGRQDGKPRWLPQKDAINVMHRLLEERRLLVHARCTGVLQAMRTMQAKPDGTIDKVSGRDSPSDQISAYGDALRYGVWRPFAHVLVTNDTKFAHP